MLGVKTKKMASIPPEEFVHQMGRRARHHDYYSRCIYHITLRKAPEAPAFSKVIGDPRLPDWSPEAPRVILTPVGEIVNREITGIERMHPALSLIEKVIMPDHIHLILFVRDRVPQHPGRYIAAAKARCKKLVNEAFPELGWIKIFEPKYVDVIISREGQLPVEIDYVRKNPRKLQLMRHYPDFFVRNISITFDSERLMGFGNPFLLKKHFRFQVHVRKHWNDEEFYAYRKKCYSLCRAGGIAVSPFYSPREKIIYQDIVEAGGEIIRVHKEKLGERYKPGGREFDLCAAGRLLIIHELEAPEYDPKLTRGQAVRLNGLAERLCVMRNIQPVFKVLEG